MKSIETLYLEYRQDIYRYLLGLTRDSALAEDLLSETFVRAILSLGRFRGESSVKTWLFGIARNLWLHSLRDRPRIGYEELAEIAAEGNIAEDVDRRHLAERVQILMGECSERTRAVFQLRLEGRSYQEISRRLGISENSARVLAYRTRKWLREKLEKEGLV